MAYLCDTFSLFVIWIRLFACWFGSTEITLFYFYLFVVEQTKPILHFKPYFYVLVFELWCWTINIDRHRHRHTHSRKHTVYASFHFYERLSWHRTNINVMKYPFNSSFFHFFSNDIERENSIFEGLSPSFYLHIIRLYLTIVIFVRLESFVAIIERIFLFFFSFSWEFKSIVWFRIRIKGMEFQKKSMFQWSMALYLSDLFVSAILFERKSNFFPQKKQKFI